MQFIRESIFISAIRSFCICFAACLGVVIAIIAVLFGLGIFSSNVAPSGRAELVIAPDAEGRNDLLSESAPVILRIDIHGVIGEKDLSLEKLEMMLNETETGILRKGRIKGILLHMNTPGGYSFDSAAISGLLKEYKKKHNIPVYAYVEDLCASGGMYIATAADKIYTTPYSIVGSVGVIMPTAFNVTGTMEKYGVQALTLSQGKDKDPLNPFRPWSPDEGQPLKPIMTALYQQFVDAIVTARPQISKEQLINDYGARVFIAADALTIGMIDNANSGYSNVLQDLCQASGIKEKEKYQVFKFRILHSIIEDLTQGKSSILQGKITHSVQIGNGVDEKAREKFLYLYEPTLK